MQQGANTEKEPVLLSISMLASRKWEQVRRCLDSLAQVMDVIPSELIIVDTSKNPDIHARLLEYTDQVVGFDWCNDFSKARNVGLKLARGEWFLYIDDDEWFEDVEELLSFFQSGEYKKYGCANYIQRNYHDPKLVNYSDSWASRMIRRGENTRFCSKIHEYLYPQEGECKNIHAVVGHTGYIYQTKEDKLQHFERNYPLLLDMMKEEPERLRWRVHIVQELFVVQKWRELAEFCGESLEFSRDRMDEWDSRDIGTFYAGALEGFLNLGSYDKAEEIGTCMEADKRCSELCHAYIDLLLAQANYRQRHWENAQKYLNRFFELKSFFETRPQKLEIQQGALLVGGAFDPISVKRAYSLLIGCGLAQGDTSAMRKYFPALEWSKPVIYVSDDLYPILMEGMACLPMEPVFEEAMRLLWNNNEMQKRMFVEIQGWQEKDEKCFDRLLRLTARIKAPHWYVWYAKILVAEEEQDIGHLAEDFRQFCQYTPDVFLTPDNVSTVLKKHGVSIEEGYLSVPFETWKEQLKTYLSKAPLNDVLLTERELIDMRTRDSLHFDYAFVRIAEAKVLHSVSKKEYQTKRDCLIAFAHRGSEFARRYYRTELIENYPELLLEYLQSALLLEQAFAEEEEDEKKAAKLQCEAAEVYPNLAGAVRSYMQAAAEERRQRAQAAKEELRQLKQKVEEQAREWIQTKQYDAALEILASLRKMCPDDLEVAELTLKARLGSLDIPCQN